MKNIVKGGLAGAVALQASVASAIVFEGSTDGASVEQGLKGTETTLATSVQGFIEFLIGFLYLVAVVYALWGGFHILTGGGDEERVKKGKTVIIQAVIGIIVIFLASSVISFVIDKLLLAGA